MAKKKIYDITPPKVAYKVENTIKEMAVNDKPKKAPKKAKVVFQSAKLIQPPQPTQSPQSIKQPQPLQLPEGRKRRFPLREILVGSSVILILLCIYFYNTLPKADIEIWPKTEVLSLQEKVKSDKSVTSVDFDKKVIPAQYVEVEKASWQEFQATGSASNDGKATGTMKIYNKISPSSSFTLKIGTHFLSDSGKYFITLDKVTIPGMNGNTPGSISVKVQAEESGEDHNIGSSKFSVPKLSGTSYYYSIWGESTSAMSGGYAGKVKKVTNKDIVNAKDALTKQLLDQAEKSLRDNLAEGDIVLDGAVAKTIIEASADVKEGAIVDKFTQQAKVKVSALIFKKQDLESFAKTNISSQLSPAKKLLENSLDLSYASTLIDMKLGTQTLDVQMSAKTYYSIDTVSLVDVVSTKSADQIKRAIDENYGEFISELKVNFWPFWVKSAPKNTDRIKIDLLFK